MIDIAFAPEGEGDSKWEVMAPSTRRDRPWLMDLRQVIGGDNRVAYLRTRVKASAAGKARLERGCDDGIKAWVNGELVHRNNRSGGVSPGSEVVEIELREGWNELLLKIVNGGGDWGACARVVATDGKPIANLEAGIDR